MQMQQQQQNARFMHQQYGGAGTEDDALDGSSWSGRGKEGKNDEG
jgi:hypothetical protein